MKNIYFITLLAIIILSGSGLPAQSIEDHEDWIQLFNGKNLDHWIPKITGFELADNYANTFRAEDEVMKVVYDGYTDFDRKFGHIFYDKPFSFYKIRVEYRFVSEQAPNGPGWAFRNSGIMIHCQSPESMAVDQDFPISIEVQLLGGDGENERPNANLCTPGTHVVIEGKLETQHCISSSSETYHGDQWVTVEVEVLGDSLITHYVNGEPVIQYSKPQVGGEVVNDFNESAKKDGTPLTEGYISLQSESHPIEFRKVELLDLKGCMDPDAKNYKSYYVKSDNNQCIY